jgi:molecular chaperone GrpE (heat shock protein)
MNAARRKEILKLVGELSELAGKLSDLRDAVESIKSDEEDYRDNMPENLQQSERYQLADAACDALDSAVSDLENMDIEGVISYLETAAE